jgi:hypothetical protein
MSQKEYDFLCECLDTHTLRVSKDRLLVKRLTAERDALQKSLDSAMFELRHSRELLKETEDQFIALMLRYQDQEMTQVNTEGPKS